VADFLSAWGHSRTGHNNWHFFNVLILSFLKNQGFAVDEAMLREHLHHLLSWYVGDGWYRDGVNFTNYSHWAFQYYAAVWSHWYGQRHHPEIAAVFRERHAVMMQSLHRFFGREGQSLLWTRSAPYRYAASAALATGCLWEDSTDDNPGWSRRIASGNMLQFLTRPDVFENRIPTLGFYRRFAPAVEAYLSPASVFWCGKNTAALLLPADSPFWTEPENEGIWAGEPVAATVTLPGPGLTVTNDSRSDATEIRPGKVPLNQAGDLRLSFHSHFPWESEGGEEALRSQTYSLKQHGTEKPFEEALRTHYIGLRDGVLYRMLEFAAMRPVIDLAEIPIPGGVIRIDRIRIHFPYELRLSHYGLPLDSDTPEESEALERDGYPYVSVRSDQGELHLGILHGWDKLRVEERSGSNPVAERSRMPVATASRPKLYGGYQLAVSVMLANASARPLTADEIQPVAELEILPLAPSGSPLGCHLRLKDDRRFTIDFAEAEGALSL
jgi:pterin-4a-carbinolamine dehydratase